MKRTIPLLITALGGFVLIIAYFIPATQGWGEVAAIWFDVLAAIAFILGGGNLLKIHLKKVSDRGAGWGYSIITAFSFLFMLFVGLTKWGAPPAPNQEYYGQTLAQLSIEALPETLMFSIPGSIPAKTGDAHLHHSVVRQVGESNGNIVFRGWMRGDQLGKLAAYKDSLEWKCNVEKLHDAAQPSSDALKGQVAYYADHEALSISGAMTQEQRTALLALGSGDEWTGAVNELYEQSQVVTTISAPQPPPVGAPSLAGTVPDVTYQAGQLSIEGPMGIGQRTVLASMFPKAKPLSDDQMQAFLAEIEEAGPLAPEQVQAFEKVMAGMWTRQQLVRVINEAGIPEEVEKTACEMYAEQQAGAESVEPKKTVGTETSLNQAQLAAIQAFVETPAPAPGMTAPELVDRLKAEGEFTSSQSAALSNFLGSAPTVGERNKTIAFGMMKAKDAQGNRFDLNKAQRDLLLDDYRAQVTWRQQVGELFVASNPVKFPWSGEYRAQGTPFWWLYEYAFKPLQATIFAMLAFYVASAAFRAFRAKNVEAILLLGTAFIILLGRTFAGVWLTSWMPDSLSGLKLENLTVYIMQVFNTAGNRAIMIGIALGIASTSLKVLLGVDRSYLGSGQE